MQLATNVPDEILKLWSGIKARLESTNAPIFQWSITDAEFAEIEQFQRKYVKNGRGRFWRPDTIQRHYGRLFLVWCAEDYRRNQSYRQDLATYYQQACAFSPGDWRAWITKGEEALSRKSIEIGDQTRHVARIQHEAGIQRRFFEQYEAGGKKSSGEENIYWRCLLELWDRLDAPPSQIVRWQEGVDWYGRAWQFRAGGVGYGQEFFGNALDLLQQIRSLSRDYSRDHRVDVGQLIEALQDRLDDSDGARQFLTDLFEERSVRKAREQSWEPRAERILYTQGSPSFWTRIRSKPSIELPDLFKSADASLVRLHVEGGGCREELAKYFLQTGQRYLFDPEIMRHPTEQVSVRLECGEAALTSILLEQLDLDEVWVFELQDNGEGTWKYRQIPSGEGPFLVSPPMPLANRISEFELDQVGVNRRQVYRFESMEEILASGLELITGIEASYRLALRGPLQEMRVSRNGRPCAVSLGWPRSSVLGGNVMQEDFEGNWKPIPIQPPTQPVPGHYKIERRGTSGTRKRVVVLPERFGFQIERITDNSCRVVFEGVDLERTPKPFGPKWNGTFWEALSTGEYLTYDWNGVAIEIPVHVPGIGWSGKSDNTNGVAVLADVQNMELHIAVPQNPVCLVFNMTLESQGKEIAQLRFEQDFFGWEDWIRTRVFLDSIGNGAVRKMFAMTNELDASVRVEGVVRGENRLSDRVPALIVRRFESGGEGQRHFLFSPLDPMNIQGADNEGLPPGAWLKIPAAEGQDVWNGSHRPTLRLPVEASENVPGSLRAILSGSDPLVARAELMDHFDEMVTGTGLDQDWSLVLDTFQSLRLHRIPPVSVWLVQAVLHDDRIVCKMFEKSDAALQSWFWQTSRNRFSPLGFDWRLIRPSVVDSFGRKTKEMIWGHVYRAHASCGISELPNYAERVWIASPELRPGGEGDSLLDRWNQLYHTGTRSEESNATSQEDWNTRRVSGLDSLRFASKATGNGFKFDHQAYSDWPGFDTAWDRRTSPPPRWIQATHWLGWFTTCATDKQYQQHHGDALRFLRQLETTDAQWVRDALPLAQARASLSRA